jgi:hypothetical protein
VYSGSAFKSKDDFTVAYPGITSEELSRRPDGISAISLSNTSSQRLEGIRACVSLVSEQQIPELRARLELFHENQRLPASLV